MKATGIVTVASTAIMAAASYWTAAVSGSLSDPKLEAPNQQGRASSSSQDKQKQEDGFTPIFDGLRFIESLVTAHR
ncbi:hypothetical protein BHE74_00045283 [Ensete ventricosum]|nr:hypothetical protein BHE74_00045283 [Ensete ventricosum]